MVEKLAVRYPDFARRLQSQCVPHGWEIKDIQKRLNVTYEMARRYWRGIAKPRGKKFDSLADWLGVQKAWLEHGEGTRLGGPTFEEAQASYRTFSAAAEQIAIAFEKLSPEQQSFYRDAIFRDAAIAEVWPWFKQGRPPSESYDRYEEAMEVDFQSRIRQLKLDL